MMEVWETETGSELVRKGKGRADQKVDISFVKDGILGSMDLIHIVAYALALIEGSYAHAVVKKLLVGGVEGGFFRFQQDLLAAFGLESLGEKLPVSLVGLLFQHQH